MRNYVFCSQFFLEPKHIFEPVSSNMQKRTFSAKDSETLQYFQNYSKLPKIVGNEKFLEDYSWLLREGGRHRAGLQKGERSVSTSGRGKQVYFVSFIEIALRRRRRRRGDP